MAQRRHIVKSKLNNIQSAGVLPSERMTREDYKDPQATYYLHSSISGFNADYVKLSHQAQLGIIFQRLYQDTYTQALDAINILKSTAKAARPVFFQNTQDDGRPIEQSPLGQLLLKGIDAKTEDAKLASALSGAKNVLNWYTFENEVINQLNQDYMKGGKRHKKESAEAQAFYASVGKEISDKLQNFVTLAEKHTELPELHQVYLLITDLLHSAADMGRGDAAQGFTNAILTNKLRSLLYDDGRGQLASLMGLAYEDAIAMGINSFLGNSYEAIRVGLQERLSDIIVKSKTNFDVTNTIPTFGISAKLRRKNQFSFNVAVQPYEVLERIRDYGGDDADNVLNDFAFIYNNYVALSVWNSSDEGPRGMSMYKAKRGEGVQRHRSTITNRRESLMGVSSKLGQFFYTFAKYINILIYTTAFFGNRVDANNVSIFDPNYFANIKQGYGNSNQNVAPPAFIQTANHLYETWTIFDSLFNSSDLVFSTGEIFGRWMAPTKLYTSDQLYKIYSRKRMILTKDHESNTIYGALFDDGNIMASMPSMNLFADLMSQLKNADGTKMVRKLSRTLKLADSY